MKVWHNGQYWDEAEWNQYASDHEDGLRSWSSEPEFVVCECEYTCRVPHSPGRCANEPGKAVELQGVVKHFCEECFASFKMTSSKRALLEADFQENSRRSKESLSNYNKAKE
jgi:hypothetical protein